MQIFHQRLVGRERDFLAHPSAIAWQVGHHIIGSKRQVVEAEMAVRASQGKAQDALFGGIEQEHADIRQTIGAIAYITTFLQPRLAIEVMRLESPIGIVEHTADEAVARMEARLHKGQVNIHIVDIAIYLNHV